MSLVKKLFVEYPDFVIDIENWEILDHGITALSGPSGSGKSTIVKILADIESYQKLDWNFKYKNNQQIGLVLQDPILFPHMTAYENIFFAIKCRKKSSPQLLKKVEDWIDFLNMHSFLNRKIAILSGGEKKRVALVQSLAIQPDLLLLDEPFSALNEDLRNKSRQIVKSLVKDIKIPILIVSHDQEDILGFADKVTFLEKGRIKNEQILTS